MNKTANIFDFSTFWVSLQQPDSSIFKTTLFLWHFIFVFIAWNDRVTRGFSDAHYYWAENFSLAEKSWFSFFSYGTDFVVWLNYPFIKLGIPFLGGFILYGLIGYFAFLNFIHWITLVLGTSVKFGKINLLLLLFFWPNLHYWTAVLGKEALIFWSLSVLFLGFTTQQFKNLSFVIAVLMLLVIRPHVGLLLLAAGGLAYLITADMPFRRKLKKVFFLLPFAVVLFYMVLTLSKIKYLDWERIVRFNRGSVLSFSDSGSYVPMETYSWFYRLVSFYFRPFLWEATSFRTAIVGLDNLIYLILHGIALVFLYRYFSKLKQLRMPFWWYTAVFFSLFCGMVFIYRYANFGIFMRTKIMYAPFMVVALLWLSFELKNITVLNRSKN